MSSYTPEDWPRQFTHHLNAGALEAVVALYAPDARFVARSGDTVVCHDRMRDVLAGLIGAHTRLQRQVIQAITVGEVALLYTDFQGTTVEASGTTVEIRHKAIEILRTSARRHLAAHRGGPQRPCTRGRRACTDKQSTPKVRERAISAHAIPDSP